eukprot:384988-Karenia_brevis.AAC.1
MVAEQIQAAAAASSNPDQPIPASSTPDQTVDFEERMMKMVCITVKQIMGEIVPHLLRPQQESIKT